MASFSTFACQLNELEEGVAPTDSRNRPDQRLMEEGKFEQANEEKMKLEEKQRRGIRERSDVESEYQHNTRLCFEKNYNNIDFLLLMFFL